MALAARQCATSLAGRPGWRSRRPARLFNAASGSRAAQVDCSTRDCAPAERVAMPNSPFSARLAVLQPRTEWARRCIRVQAADGANDQQLGTPPWERPAEDDGLDALRQRIRQYGLQSKEEKMLLLLRELKADEQRSLKLFAKAEDEGEYASMRLYHSQWKNRTEKMQLLVDDPRKFVEEHGYLYDLETTAERSARWDRECTAAGLKAVAWTVSVFLLVYSLTYLIVSVL